MKPLRLPTIQGLGMALRAVTGRTGASTAELYVKTGCSLRIEIAPWQPGRASPSAPEDWRSHVGWIEENGWALRAGGAEGALFLAESGTLPAPGGWRRLNRHSLRPGSLRLPGLSGLSGLPAPGRRKGPQPEIAGKAAPNDDSATLGRDLIRDVLERTRTELPGAHLVRARIDDGACASILANSAGVTGRTSVRLATIGMEFFAERNGTRGPGSLYRAASDLTGLDAAGIAAEAADRLILATAAAATCLPAGEVAAAPCLAASLLALLAPLFRGRAGWNTLQRLGSRRSLGPPDLHILDDGALDTGWISASVDDEGVPTRAVTLIRDGQPGEPLLTWEDDGWSGFSATGCRRRSGWRSPPEISHSHLYIDRGPESADAIRSGIRHGCYLLDCVPGGRRHAVLEVPDNEGEARFEIDATGFAVEHGRVRGAIPRARLGGSIRQLFRGIRAVGDDLRFLPAPGAVGAPTLLLTGLQLEPVA